uniref:Uncharacterized protein n=1 Tax=Panagrolaimus davidi TaxID=227884 RepID=A0A914QRB8_9BILA
MHVTLTFAGCSILVGLIYQYYSLCDNVEFFHTRKDVFIIFFLMSIYPIPSLTLHLLSGYDNEKFIQDVKTRAPHLYPLVISAPCNGTPFNGFTIAYLIDTIFQIIAIFIAFLVSFYKILKKWSMLKHTMSANTLKLRKQYLTTLCLHL